MCIRRGREEPGHHHMVEVRGSEALGEVLGGLLLGGSRGRAGERHVDVVGELDGAGSLDLAVKLLADVAFEVVEDRRCATPSAAARDALGAERRERSRHPGALGDSTGPDALDGLGDQMRPLPRQSRPAWTASGTLWIRSASDRLERTFLGRGRAAGGERAPGSGCPVPAASATSPASSAAAPERLDDAGSGPTISISSCTVFPLRSAVSLDAELNDTAFDRVAFLRRRRTPAARPGPHARARFRRRPRSRPRRSGGAAAAAGWWSIGAAMSRKTATVSMIASS